ncbi:hypothetical protein POF63_02075 [Streptococcus agalactiae]|uniref:hypothetical protein n=1 Tax=Streptococcus agalactiae TaxID=1311 RepID=UPI0002BA6FAD|nr:hypothetical protein [Streptococcus agalactiae]AIX04131.1 putative membrane protein [Streptococcus agalactiae CNCTC 10/84]EPT57113.1 hypothetical protein SAG0053_08135 [Streptococcus agalactiae CCUG 25532]EPT86845.1 hypothetical protein SAG0099_07365 [Streptococcus agalactiae BSU247]EPV22820.1 hypothetical protein SAG0334_10365 [Streptococcus agalactiae GB00640]EPW98604.1 hypothetical protein SAG0147_03180 [Streptococcus agalactiae MRI Z1-048]
MKKLIWSHLFAIVSILGIWYYHVKIDHLMVILLASVLSLEMGFIAYYSRNIFIRLLASLGLLFFYPQSLGIFLSLVSLEWSTKDIWQSNHFMQYMAYLLAILFIISSALLSLKLLVNAYDISKRYQLATVIPVMLFSSFAFCLEKSGSLGLEGIILNPSAFFNGIQTNIVNLDFKTLSCLFLVQLLLWGTLMED